MHSETTDRLIKCNVAAPYQRYNSAGVSVVIQPDQSMKQMMENESSVSSARNTIGIRTILPSCAIVQYSNGAFVDTRSRAARPAFMQRSSAAHAITSHPLETSRGQPDYEIGYHLMEAKKKLT